jgi:hypothetical protein
MKTVVMGIVVLLAGCAHRPAPDCEAHLVPIQVPTVPGVEMPTPNVSMPVLAEPHP